MATEFEVVLLCIRNTVTATLVVPTFEMSKSFLTLFRISRHFANHIFCRIDVES